MQYNFPHTATITNPILDDATQTYGEAFIEKVFWQPLDTNDAIQGDGMLVNKSKIYAKADSAIHVGAIITLFSKNFNVTGVDDRSQINSALKHKKFILTEMKNGS